MSPKYAIVLASLLAVPVAAENLVPNPHFDVDTSGWGGPGVVWSPDDELDDPGSGVARIDVAEGHGTSLFSTCLPLTPGEAVVFGASVKVVDGLPVDARARARLRYFANDTCGPTILSESSYGEVVARGGSSAWGATQGDAIVPAEAHSAYLWIELAAIGGSAAFLVDNAYLIPGASCAPTGRIACLSGSRFRVTAEWETPAGDRGQAAVQPLSGDSAYLWFFDPKNLELVIKVLDGCGYNENYWIYAAGLTNLGVKLTVTDTLADESWTYDNPLDLAFPPRQDIEAFATCDIGPIVH